jgi:hypothetical protein
MSRTVIVIKQNNCIAIIDVNECCNSSHVTLSKLKAFPLLSCLVCDWFYSHNLLEFLSF